MTTMNAYAAANPAGAPMMNAIRLHRDTDAFRGGALRGIAASPQQQLVNQLARRQPQAYSVTPWRQRAATRPAGAVGDEAQPSRGARLVGLLVGAAITSAAIGVGAYYGAKAAAGG